MPFLRCLLLLLLPLLLSCTRTGVHPQGQGIAQYEQIRGKHISIAKPQIVIDAGHGGFDYGAHSAICEEKEVCLKTAHLLKRHLLQKGYRVVMTRVRDEFVPLKRRAQLANISRSQLFVSIHYNAAKNEKASGVEIYYYDAAEPWKTKRSKQFAQIALKRLTTLTGAQSRGVKEGNFCVIRETKMPSVLVEGGFVSNPSERSRLCDVIYLDKIATALAESVDQYFKTI